MRVPSAESFWKTFQGNFMGQGVLQCFRIISQNRRAGDNISGWKRSSLRGALSLSASFMTDITSSRRPSWMGHLSSSQTS